MSDSETAAVGWLRRKLLSVIKENATGVPRYTALAPWKSPIRPKTPRPR